MRQLSQPLHDAERRESRLCVRVPTLLDGVAQQAQGRAAIHPGPAGRELRATLLTDHHIEHLVYAQVRP